MVTLQKRHILEEGNELDPRTSALDDDLEDMETSEEEGEFKVRHSLFQPIFYLFSFC